MKPDLLKNLPSEIAINIFSKLPVRSIARSKCVCKPWLNLLSTDDFVNSHLSKSVHALAFSMFGRVPNAYQVFEFEDEIDGAESHDFRSNQVTKFDLPHNAVIVGAANGLLLLQTLRSIDVYVCNPVTREYVELRRPKEEFLFGNPPTSGAYEFGASRISGQHKVVWISDKSECYVYTLETGSWRRVAVEPAHASLCCTDICNSAFVGGNLYWTVPFDASTTLVACFDLETERFSSFDAPAMYGDLSVLNGCLCFYDCEDEIVVWLMKDKSWSKEFVIQKSRRHYYRACPINAFKNGEMLMLCKNIFIRL